MCLPMKFSKILRTFFAEHLQTVVSNNTIIARFFGKTYCSLKWNIKGFKNNCFLKISMYLLNIFNESKDNNNITTILTCLDTNPGFSKKLIFKNSKNLLHTLNLSFISSKISYKSK